MRDSENKEIIEIASEIRRTDTAKENNRRRFRKKLHV